MSRGKPFETHPPLFPGPPPGAGAGHLSPLFSSHLQAAVASAASAGAAPHPVPGLHHPYFALPNPFLHAAGVTGHGAGQKSPILSRQNGAPGMNIFYPIIQPKVIKLVAKLQTRQQKLIFLVN